MSNNLMGYATGSAGAAAAAQLQSVQWAQKDMYYQMIARRMQNDAEVDASQASATSVESQYKEDATANRDGAIGSFVGAGLSAGAGVVGAGLMAYGSSAEDAVDAAQQNNVNINNRADGGGGNDEVQQAAEAERTKAGIQSRTNNAIQLSRTFGEAASQVAQASGTYDGAGHTQKAGGFAGSSKLYDTVQTLAQQNASGNTSFVATLMDEISGKLNQVLTIASYNAG